MKEPFQRLLYVYDIFLKLPKTAFKIKVKNIFERMFSFKYKKKLSLIK